RTEGGGLVTKIIGAMLTGLMSVSSSLTYGAVKDDGNRLLSECNNAVLARDSHNLNDAEFARGFYCLGRLQGVKEMNEYYRLLLNKMGKKSSIEFCLPKGGVENGQASRIVVKFLRDHPDQLDEVSVILIIDAFRAAFPCK
ncbi:Rap1a/Tai family immunity protein, partial [Pseudomonadota bacterium]